MSHKVMCIQEEAANMLECRVRCIMVEALKINPTLITKSSEKLAAVTSLVYNVGQSAYKTSTVAKCIANGDYAAAADAFLLRNRAQGRFLQGLVNRRKMKRDLFLAVS